MRIQQPPEMTMPFLSLCRTWVRVMCALTMAWGAATAMASPCAQDLQAVDLGLKAQYGGDGAWWMIFACPVDMGSRLKKNAIVNGEQIKSISSMRNLAYLQMSRGDEALCTQTLAPAKRLLRLH